MDVVQYIGGCSVHRGVNISTVGIASVLWRLFSTVGDSFSTVEVVQYIGGITSVHVGDNISTVGDNISTVEGNISTVEGIQYCGGIPSVLWGDNSSTCGG